MTDFDNPWWLDSSRTPQGDGKAQPIWMLGQWQFIPWAFGTTPLCKWCATLAEAAQVAKDYENYVETLEGDLLVEVAFPEGEIVGDHEGEHCRILPIFNIPGEDPDYFLLILPSGTPHRSLFRDTLEAEAEAKIVLTSSRGYGG